MCSTSFTSLLYSNYNLNNPLNQLAHRTRWYPAIQQCFALSLRRVEDISSPRAKDRLFSGRSSPSGQIRVYNEGSRVFTTLLMQRETAQWRKRVRLGRIHALLEYNPCAEGSRGLPLYYLRSPPLLCVRAQQPRRYNTPFFYKANRGWRSGSASSQITHRLELVFTRVSASAYKYHWDDRLEKTCDRGMNWRRFSKRPIRFANRYSGWNFFLRSWISNRWYILFYAICIIILHVLNIAMNILDIHI